MKKQISFSQRLRLYINRRQPIVKFWDESLERSARTADIKARATEYAANNPQPRATFLLG